MRRRDFLALCAAAVGCAAVPALATEQTSHTIHARDVTSGVQYEWIQIHVGDQNLWWVIEKD